MYIFFSLGDSGGDSPYETIGEDKTLYYYLGNY